MYTHILGISPNIPGSNLETQFWVLLIISSRGRRLGRYPFRKNPVYAPVYICIPQSIIDRAAISCLYSYNGECTAIRVTLCTNSGLKWLMKNFRNNRHKQMSYIGIFNNHGQSLKSNNTTTTFIINILGYDAALQRFHVRTQYHPNCRTHVKAGLQLCYILLCGLCPMGKEHSFPPPFVRA